MTALTPVIISGPTASGKSNLAEDLAEILSGEIINADSLQVYKGLPILTAQPRVLMSHHHLYASLEPFDKCDVSRWLTLAQQRIKLLQSQSKRPIVVGGTGLYIKALKEGLAEIPQVPEDILQTAKSWVLEKGIESLYADLATKDSLSQDLSITDVHRVIRAWSVYESTGKSIKTWQDRHKKPIDMSWIHVVCEIDRDVLYRRTNDRFQFMWSNGILDEVRLFQAQYQGIKSNYAAKAIGFSEVLDFLKGKIPEIDAIEKAQARTRQYAKRQITWLKHQVRPDLQMYGPKYDVSRVVDLCNSYEK